MKMDITSNKINLVGREADINQIREIFNREDIHFSNKNISKYTDILPFGDDSFSAIALTLGSSSLVLSISQCVFTYIQGRKKKISVQVKNGETKVIAENCSIEEIALILQSITHPVAVIAEDSHPKCSNVIYNIGQAGAVGPNSRADNNMFTESIDS
jgi:hypothetical protein